jgi:hypothetical protein
MDWKEYEKLIYSEFQIRYPDCEITHNAYIEGKLSGVNRQIDVLIVATIAGNKFITVVDAKMYNKPIDVKGVEEFLSMVNDVGAQRGLMVTTKGYTPAALMRAHMDSTDIELDILTLAEYLEFQAPAGLPYSNGRGVFLSAPFGWVIDGKRREGTVTMLYQRGLDLDLAGLSHEFAYVNFWHTDEPHSPSTLDELLSLQSDNLIDEDPYVEITYPNPTRDIKYPSCVRLAKRSTHPAWEYTGLIEFENFIFFVVVFTNPETSNRNLRKLLEMMHWAVPFEILKNNQAQ